MEDCHSNISTLNAQNLIILRHEESKCNVNLNSLKKTDSTASLFVNLPTPIHFEFPTFAFILHSLYKNNDKYVG